MQKKILIPGGKIDDLFLTQAAQKLGLYVITSGTNRNAPAHRISDEYVYANYADKEAMLKLAEEKKIDYICSCANDLGMVSTAFVCEKLGLPGHDSYENALIIHKKDRFKEMAKKIGLSTPDAVSFSDLDDAVSFLVKVNTKMIVKPVDGCAGRGIGEYAPGDCAEEVVKAAFQNSIETRIVIEPFIDGPVQSASVFIINRKVAFCFIDESFVKTTNKHAMANVIAPAGNKGEIQKALISEFEKIAKALDLADGKIHTNFIVDRTGNIQIIEMHRRCSGDTYCKFVEACTGIPWNEWIVKSEMGLSVNDFPKWAPQKKNIMYSVLTPPQNGVYKGLKIDNAILEKKVYAYYNYCEGDVIEDCRVEAIGVFVSQYESYSEMKETVNKIDQYIKIDMEEIK